MDPRMHEPSSDSLETRFGRAGDDIAVRFPPGLGIIPPRELSRVPLPRKDGELSG